MSKAEAEAEKKREQLAKAAEARMARLQLVTQQQQLWCCCALMKASIDLFICLITESLAPMELWMMTFTSWIFVINGDSASCAGE